MERDDRPPVATFYIQAAIAAGVTLSLGDAAAHHARVKRLEVGDRVRVTDGLGTIAVGELATLDKRDATVTLHEVQAVQSPPAIHLRVPIGDRDRMLMLAEKATELGVASWQAVRFRRSMSVTPRGEGPGFAEKVRARMIAALEQSAGAWLPVILDDAPPQAVTVPEHASRILLDAAGTPLLRLPAHDVSVILLGPEGGVEDKERDALIQAGWQKASLAGTTLRFETAGIAAVSVLRAAHLTQES